jgi:hypothetical protein
LGPASVPSRAMSVKMMRAQPKFCIVCAK